MIQKQMPTQSNYKERNYLISARSGFSGKARATAYITGHGADNGNEYCIVAHGEQETTIFRIIGDWEFNFLRFISKKVIKFVKSDKNEVSFFDDVLFFGSIEIKKHGNGFIIDTGKENDSGCMQELSFVKIQDEYITMAASINHPYYQCSSQLFLDYDSFKSIFLALSGKDYFPVFTAVGGRAWTCPNETYSPAQCELMPSCENKDSLNFAKIDLDLIMYSETAWSNV